VASSTTKKGSAIPSLSPLSTFRPCRTDVGTPRIGDSGLPEGGVGRRQDDGEQCELPDREAGQQQPGSDRAEQHREWQPESEQSQRQRVVAAKR
jgi:hypothetical protein